MLTDLRKDLIRDEGYMLTAYLDSMNKWTIGIGHLIDDGKNVPRISRLSPAEVDAFFEYDVKQAEAICKRLIPNWVLLDDVRQDALLNMAFNLGNRLEGFVKFLASVNRYASGHTILVEEFLVAGREMMDSVWAKQVGQRAVRLRHMIETGDRMS